MPASIRIRGSPCQAQEAEEQRVLFLFFFFSKSHREKPPLVLFAAVSADSGAATPPKIPFGHGENLPNQGGEETGAAAPIKAFAYTFPTWVLPKKGEGGVDFCKKKAFFDSGMATTTIVENLCGITNCSFLKKVVQQKCPIFALLATVSFPSNSMCYVFWRSGEKGPGVEGPSSPDRVNGP